jgi:acyl carrier protein
MESKFNINQSVAIRNHQILLDGKIVFQAEKTLDLAEFLKQAYQHLQISYPKFYKMDLLSKLGFVAVEYLTQNFTISRETALVFQNASGSLETDLNFQKSLENKDSFISPSVFVYTLPNIVLGELSIRHQLQTEQAFFISEEFNAEFLYVYVKNLLSNQKAEAVISGWLDLDTSGYSVFLSLISNKKGEVFSPENFKRNYFLNMSSLRQELKEKIIDQLNLEDLDINDIQDNDELFGDEIGLDSIDALELIVLLEKDYGIKITDPKKGKEVFYSVDTMATFIENNAK